jgi:hypothetical protein
MSKVIEFDEKCQACNGTGLYKGAAERDGFAVVCHKCGGTGRYHFVHAYEEFAERTERADIHTIVEVNPGICLGSNLDFGGMSYQDWKDGKPFPPKSEMRKYVCPAWWYQVADYDKKPKWNECLECGMFSHCKHFDQKIKCWERWDKEQEEGVK